jgi:hypothetical protein
MRARRLLIAALPLLAAAAALHQDTAPARIHDIQGSAHRSPLEGDHLTGVPGAVTAVDSDGFCLHDRDGRGPRP